jgi:hypothetical protein
MNDLLIWSLAGARAQTLSLVADLDPATACRQSVPGEHHPVWILGHLLLGDTYLLSLLGAGDLSGDFPELLERYGLKASPTGSSADYPPVATLAARLRSTGERRLSALAAMTPADLARPTPDAFLARAQPTIGHHLQALVCHEGYHAGQLSAWRHARGLGAVRWAFAP